MVLQESKHFKIEVGYSKELDRDAYFAVNKKTGVQELMFNFEHEAKYVLEDLERVRMQSNSRESTGKVVSLKH